MNMKILVNCMKLWLPLFHRCRVREIAMHKKG